MAITLGGYEFSWSKTPSDIYDAVTDGFKEFIGRNPEMKEEGAPADIPVTNETTTNELMELYNNTVGDFTRDLGNWFENVFNKADALTPTDKDSDTVSQNTTPPSLNKKGLIPMAIGGAILAYWIIWGKE